MAKRLAPWAALLTTILIWAGYLVAVRAAANSNLTAFDVGAFRSVPAALILLPLTFKRGLFPGGANWGDIFFIGIIGGTLFTLLLSTGARFAPVADSGIFAPSMLPVFVTILAVMLLGARYHPLQFLGLFVILIGALAVGGRDAILNASSGAWRGHLLFLCASFCWATYTIRFRISGLDAVSASLILVTWSAVLFLLGMLVFGTNIPQTSTSVLLVQLILGVSAGTLANFTFLFSVRHFGPAVPAAGAALVPIIAALGGWVFLGEEIGALKAIGIGVVGFGVLLASGLLTPEKPVTQN